MKNRFRARIDQSSEINPGSRVDILPEDEAIRASIFDSIEKGEMTHLGSILEVIEGSPFSSEEARRNTRIGMKYLFEQKALEPTELKKARARAVRMEIINVDSELL